MRIRSLTCIVPALLVGACVAEYDEPVDGTVQLGCHSAWCSNTAVLLRGFFELDETRTAFSQLGHYRIKSVTDAGGTPTTLFVDHFVLKIDGKTGTDIVTAAPKVQIEGFAGELYELQFNGSSTVMPFYEGRDDGTLLTTYQIQFVQIKGGKRSKPMDLCPFDGTTSLTREALFYDGVRYDSVLGRETVRGPTVGPWFNIACKDDAIWKQAIAGYTYAANRPGYMTTLDEENAYLLSMRADYCNTGTAMTKTGTHVDWFESHGWQWVDVDLTVEAEWGPNGALCLNTPRLMTRDEVEDVCGEIAWCTTEDGTTETWIPQEF